MRLAVISDIHANLEALRATLRAISAKGVDRILCLGDIVGYNSNPAECIALLREYDPICVAGNHDRAVTGQIGTTDFNPMAAQAVEWTRGRLGVDATGFLASLPLQVNLSDQVIAVHGALLPSGGCDTTRLDTDERRLANLATLSAHPSGARICVFGHTHRLGIFELRKGVLRSLAEERVQLYKDAHYLMNPGTVGQPRTTDHRATYLVLDTVRQQVEVERIDYNYAAALAKTRNAGLAPRPTDMLAPVRSALAQGLSGLGLYGPVKRAIEPWRRR